MHPSLIDFGTHRLPLLGETHLFLPTYGLLFALGAVVAWLWLMRRGRALGLPDDAMFNLSFYSILAGLLGAKLTLILVEWRYYFDNPGEILGTLRSAGVLMGGVALGAAVFVTYSRRNGLPVLKLGDAAAAPVALAQAIGRLGCFSAGCCYGVQVPADHPLAVTFTDPMAHAQTNVSLNVPLLPTQLIQMGSDLFLAAILTVMWRRRVQPDGTTMWTYILLYSLTRGIIEFWRGDTVRGMYFGGRISTSQIFAVAAASAAAFALMRLRSRSRRKTVP